VVNKFLNFVFVFKSLSSDYQNGFELSVHHKLD